MCQRFLTQTNNGAALKATEAVRDIALACSAYIHFSFTLVDPQIQHEERARQILSGFHGLHTYAYCHWTDHMKHITRSYKKADQIGDERIEALVAAACDRHNKIAGMLNMQPGMVADLTEGDRRRDIFPDSEPMQLLAALLSKLEKTACQPDKSNRKGQ